ncbi:heavy metal translocating P-type ATPase [Jiella marina]|uniref:heavy metal translocating P-type ATPase n=1 Tax=Jiella sp. LLJ827 TaxID=2917712 RepID=UPI002100DF7B|nr:heavy metal translocating P-type ATPase [Jiella sp. LLJ827]MCQ0989355.1 heavy metal translocating P-type ATPase [Jiella sp. LLJ827]
MPQKTDERAAPVWREVAERAFLPVLCILVAIGGFGWLTERPDLAAGAWAVATAAALIVLAADMVRSLRRGDFGLDVIAALAMIGALWLGEYFAGAVIALMFSGGQALEAYAERRAKGELTALLARMPRKAMRHGETGLEEIPVDDVEAGDLILVRQGEVVPVDGTVSGGAATLDESALTGESVPVRHSAGDEIMSGTLNAGDPFDLRASNKAAASTYAGIVRLVEEAQAGKAPSTRLAARFALAFLAVTLVMAGAAWFLSGDPTRALAVLVVATPCPLILAVPVAIIAGVSRTARQGVLVKGGGVLEALAGVKTVIFDKTGTVTDGRARLVDQIARPDLDPAEVLHLAASLDQTSPHVLAKALAEAARDRGLTLATPAEVRETPGDGIEGVVDGRSIIVGGWRYVAGTLTGEDEFGQELAGWSRRPGTVSVVVALDGKLAGAFLFADEVRPEAGTVLRHLRGGGVERIVLATGDRADVADEIAAFLGVDRVVAGMTPQGKIELVEEERANGPVMMVGDGVNDAPALAAAEVGVAMGARGAAASAEAADVVLLADRLDRLAGAIIVARRSRRIALQSVMVGLGLSFAAMVAAAFGYLTPVEGALLQEVIDVFAILNALRALGVPIGELLSGQGLAPADVAKLEGEHRELEEVLDAIGTLAARVRYLEAPELRRELDALDRLLNERLLPHEMADDREIYRRLRSGPGMIDALAGMSRGHMEIRRMIQTLRGLGTGLEAREPTEAERYAIERHLHGLLAITRLHFAQEDEIYRALEAA